MDRIDTPSAAATPSQSPQDAYEQVSAGLRRCLRLSRLRADAGRYTDASEYIVGALADLAPQLAVLAALLPPR
jgi:hypothetical protein